MTETFEPEAVAEDRRAPVRPLRDRVLVKVEERLRQSTGGVILPENITREESDRGEVLAVGAGRTSDHGDEIPMEVSVGDTVLFSPFAGMKVEVEDETFLLLREGDILGVVLPSD